MKIKCIWILEINKFYRTLNTTYHLLSTHGYKYSIRYKKSEITQTKKKNNNNLIFYKKRDCLYKDNKFKLITQQKINSKDFPIAMDICQLCREPLNLYKFFVILTYFQNNFCNGIRFSILEQIISYRMLFVSVFIRKCSCY